MIISIGQILPATFGQGTECFGLQTSVRGCERTRRRNWKTLPGWLLRGREGRAEIAQFVVDLVSSSYGLGDFFAEQTAVTVAQPVYEIFHCRFLKAEYPGKCRVRYILPFCGEAITQDIKDAASAALFTLVAQSAQRSLDHCCRPAHVENSFWRPVVRFLLRNRQVRWRLRHPIIPGNKTEITTALTRRTFIDVVLQKTLQRLEQE